MRAGTVRSQFNEHSEAMFLTSSFVFANAAEAAARFKGEEPGPIYARFTNPTVSMMEERLAALEGAERCVAFASGMAAILATVMGLMKAGEHVVASRSIFGSTVQLFCNILGRFGIETTYVSPTDPAEWRAAVKPNTKLFFVESPSNPLTEVSDIRALADIAHAAGAWLAVDNCFCSPALQQPLKFGADIVIHSATKYLDGQGRVLGGAVLGSQALDGRRLHLPAHRRADAVGVQRLGDPERAWRRCRCAWKRIRGMRWRWRNGWKRSRRWRACCIPACRRIRSMQLAMAQQKTGGGIVAFELKGGKDAAWKLIDATRMLSITANLGDTKTTITHPATTTHSRMTPEQRAAAGIGDGLVRIAVGLESVADIQADLARGLA